MLNFRKAGVHPTRECAFDRQSIHLWLAHHFSVPDLIGFVLHTAKLVLLDPSPPSRVFHVQVQSAAGSKPEDDLPDGSSKRRAPPLLRRLDEHRSGLLAPSRFTLPAFTVWMICSMRSRSFPASVAGTRGTTGLASSFAPFPKAPWSDPAFRE